MLRVSLTAPRYMRSRSVRSPQPQSSMFHRAGSVVPHWDLERRTRLRSCQDQLGHPAPLTGGSRNSTGAAGNIRDDVYDSAASTVTSPPGPPSPPSPGDPPFPRFPRCRRRRDRGVSRGRAHSGLLRPDRLCPLRRRCPHLPP